MDAALIAFLVTALLIMTLRPVANAVGLVDRPGGRKAHIGIVPVIGGIAMYVGMLVALPFLAPPMHGQAQFLVAAGLLVFVGAVDDRFDLRPSIRLVAQATAALIACLGAGLLATGLGGILFFGEISLGPLALPFTILVIIAVINAFNLMDGMDGLAGGVALASLLAGACAALAFGNDADGSLPLIGSAVVLGFLLFNFPAPFNRPFRTFMGDAGSTLLGFTVAWMGLRLAHGEGAVISPVTALWIAALPIFDLFISFGRRILKGQSPFQPDREHFHHILLRAGLSERQVLVVMVSIAFVVAMTGVLANQAGVPDGVLFFGLVGLGCLQVWTVRRAWRLARWIRRRRRMFNRASS